MLSEVVRSEKLFGLIAFAELVDMVQVLGSDVPLRWIWKLFAAVATHVGAIPS